MSSSRTAGAAWTSPFDRAPELFALLKAALPDYRVENISDYRSEAWIFDAKRITDGPITRIALPGRVPAGFHAAWMYGRDLWA